MQRKRYQKKDKLEFQGQNYYSKSVRIDRLNQLVLCGFSPTLEKRAFDIPTTQHELDQKILLAVALTVKVNEKLLRP